MADANRKKILNKVDASKDERDQVPPGHGRHSQRHRRRSRDPEIRRRLHGLHRPRRRYVGDGLGGVEEASGLPSGGSRLRGPPEHRRHTEGDRRRSFSVAQWPHRRHSGRQGRGMERRSLVRAHQERPHLWPRLLRHEERRREPHPRRQISQGTGPHAERRRDDQRRHRRGGERPRYARHRHSRLQGRRRDLRRDERSGGAAGMHRPHMVRDRNSRQAGRDSEAL